MGLIYRYRDKEKKALLFINSFIRVCPHQDCSHNNGRWATELNCSQAIPEHFKNQSEKSSFQKHFQNKKSSRTIQGIQEPLAIQIYIDIDR